MNRWTKVISGVAMVGLMACSPAHETVKSQSEESRTSLLFVSIDSLRADHLASYGYHRVTSPRIDGLAREGVLFEKMIADSSWTLPTHITMMTGLSSWAHGVVSDTRQLDDGVTTLAQYLQARGYRTEGFASGPYLHPVFGFGRGFDNYEVIGESIYDQDGVTLQEIAGRPSLRRELERYEDAIRRASTSDTLADRVEEAIARSGDRDFFIFAHMFDVHYDYVAPASYWRRFNPGYTGDLRGNDFMDNPRIRRGLTESDHQQLMALYDGEIAWTDHHFGRMLDSLDRYGVADKTLVIVTSDHGEEFFEHGQKGHRQTLYDEQLLVPFILRRPGTLPAGRRVRMQTRMVDIAPTVLDLLGFEGGLGEGGRSLAPYARGDKAEEDLPAMSYLYVSGILKRTLRTPDAKLEIAMPIERVGSNDPGRVASFDLAQDPSERTPISDPSVILALQAELEERFDAEEAVRQRVAADRETVVELPAALRSALEQLGYTDGDTR